MAVMRRANRWLVLNGTEILQWKGLYYTTRQWPEVGLAIVRAAGGGTLASPLVVAEREPDPTRHSRLNVEGASILESPLRGGGIEELRGRLARNTRAWTQFCRAVVAQHDVVLFRVPSPYLRYVASACREYGKPLVLMVAAHRVKGSKGIHRFPRLLRPLARAYLHYQDVQQKQIGRSVKLVFVFGGELYKEWRKVGNLVLWRTGHLTPESYQEREDTCRHQTIRLIRVCDMSPPRGVHVLLQAVGLLTARTYNIELHLVGDGDATYIEQLRRLASELTVSDRIQFHGWCSRERVYQLMRSADIQVVSSLSDAVPRVILEGAANCLPLISTNVGGIPSFVKDAHTGLLVDAGEPEQMARAIQRVASDGTLRRSLIRQSFEESKEWGIVQTQARLVEIVEAALDEERTH